MLAKLRVTAWFFHTASFRIRYCFEDRSLWRELESARVAMDCRELDVTGDVQPKQYAHRQDNQKLPVRV